MKIKLLSMALTVALSQPVVAGPEHNHEHERASNGSYTVDFGSVQTEADAFHKARIESLKKQLLKSPALVKAQNTTSDEVEITVGVLVHETWIEQMKDQLVKDTEGKYYENGAQFAVARVEAMFKLVNDAFEAQGLQARFNPVLITTINNEIIYNERNNYPEFNEIRDCVYWPDNYLNYSSKAELCTEKGYDPIRKMLNGKVDIMLYIREKGEDEFSGGLGGYLSMASFYDRYRFVMTRTSGGDPMSLSEEVRESYRFGYHNGDVLMHELGHVLETFHQVSESEPAFENDYNRAWRCGNYYNITTGEVMPERGQRFTIMAAASAPFNTQHHLFFSNPDTVVEGERCGVSGEADNTFYVKKNTPLAAALTELPEITSESFFVESELTLNRTEQKGVITIRRTGDTTQPAYINLLAEDGTAWEQRDFDFGLKTVTFEAGETEKTVEFTLLERQERHSDVEFKVKMIKGLHTSLDIQDVKVTVLTDKPLQFGEVGFESSQISTTEGDILEVVLTRNNGSDGDATFLVTSADGTAVAGTDYTALSETVTIKDGETSASVLLNTTNRSAKQGARTVTLNITDVQGADSGTTQATVTINDALEYGQVNFTQSSLTVNENNTATLVINRTNGTDGEVSVNVRTVNGSAVAGTDFTAVDQIVNFGDGQSTASVTITLNNRNGNQGARTFQVQMREPVGGVEVGAASTVSVTINDVAASGGDSGGSSGGSMSIWLVILLLLLGPARLMRNQ